MSSKRVDVVVIGGGHAGIEAACAAARCNAKTLLITQKLSTIGEMSCNPSFGGIGKGALLREIDALDGVCARICDEAGIHFRLLNASKGAAVHGPRAQIDRKIYKEKIQQFVKQCANLEVAEGSVDEIVVCNNSQSIKSVILNDGIQIDCRKVIITTGTFLGGEIHIGEKCIAAGRRGEAPSLNLSQFLKKVGFCLGRMRTGTPPRLLASSIDFSQLQEQPSDNPPVPFSFLNDSVSNVNSLIKCHITRTTAITHEIIRKNLHRTIHIKEEVKGPRYCPSLEAKVIRFGDRNGHPVWLEPEGLDSPLIYPNGISNSLPEEVQDDIVRSIPGLENAQIEAYGYGVEYDFVNPRQLHETLETKKIHGLFLAGQINGTTGYEEAAAQGIIAGLNAGLACGEEASANFVLKRSEAYIGVLVNDLVSNGVDEPYRMFTSRSEFRLSVRPDNADTRLTPKLLQYGLVSEERNSKFHQDQVHLQQIIQEMQQFKLSPSAWLAQYGVRNAHDGQLKSAFDLVQCDTFSKQTLFQAIPSLQQYKPKLIDRAFIEATYCKYMKIQENSLKVLHLEEDAKIPSDFNYESLGFLSNEAKQRLQLAQPTSLAALRRVAGLTPDVVVKLFNFMRKPLRLA